MVKLLSGRPNASNKVLEEDGTFTYTWYLFMIQVWEKLGGSEDRVNDAEESLELIELIPTTENIPQDALLPPVVEREVEDDLAPRFEPDQDALTAADIGDTVQAFSADLDIYAANPLTAGELGQLQNINSVTITNVQWTFLGDFDQGLATTDTVTFAAININGEIFQSNALGVTHRLRNTDTTLVKDQLLGAIDFEQSDTSGGGPGVVAAVRAISDSSTGSVTRLVFFVQDASSLVEVLRFSFTKIALFVGRITTDDTTEATTTTDGSIQTDGGISAVKNIIGGSVVKSGDGITASRPTPQGPGSMFFDTTLGIPIWHDGTNWIDATGTTV